MALEIFRLMGSVFVDTDKANSSLHKIDKKAEGFGKRLLGGIGTAAKWAAGVAVAAGAAGAAIGAAAVKSYAEYEQLVGGIETLFGKSAGTVTKYAQGAYKTAGMTASQYMETATSFAAALLAGLKGDTEAAAKYTDMAITDMSDNANKMGTNITNIQNAYQGFAKQNYSMLDNLKLGYGGTKKEMQRLLKDADAINKQQGKITKYSLDNLNDVYEAIHVVQTEMGITDTTAKEATSTISGQIGMLKARFENFKTSLGESLAPVVKNILGKLIDSLPVVEKLVGGLVTTTMKVVDKAMPYITKALDIVGKGFDKLPGIAQKVQDKFSEFGDFMGQKLQPVIQTARDWFDKLKDSAADFPAKLQAFKDKAAEVGDYIAGRFQPTIDNLRKMFEAVKDKLQPFIDKLAEYVKSGEAAEDATQLLKDAGQLLKDAFDKVAEGCGWVTEKVIEFSDWCVEHYKTIETIAIVVGSFAAAWGLVNGALALWNGLCTVGAAVTGALAGAGTVLAGVWAFLTAPITLVIAAIGAVIAIGVLLWRNWDTIKAKASELWKALVDKFSQIKENVVNKCTELKNAAVNKFQEMKDGVVNWATNMWAQIKEKFEQIKADVSLAISTAKQTVVDTFSGMYNSVRDKVASIYNAIKDKFAAAKTAITKPIEDAKNSISNAVAAIKRAFDFKLKLDLSWPEIKVYGGKAPWGIGGEGYLPTIDVIWHAKAMEKAMLLDDPTLFGMNGAGQLLGAGEAGREVVVGEAHLLKMMGQVVAQQTAVNNSRVEALLADILEAIAGGNSDVVAALLAGQTIQIGEREFARAVRQYA